MRNLAISLLALTLVSCSHIRERINAVTETPSVNPSSTSVQPSQTIGELLKRRVLLCQQDKIDRADQLKKIRIQASKIRKTKKNNPLTLADKLDGLLLSTCDPANTPTFFNEMMQLVSNEGNWPEDYDAFFDLLRAQQRSLMLVQNHALDLSKELDSTKAKLDTVQGEYKKTIRSIGDIEENLDSRRPTSPRVP